MKHCACSAGHPGRFEASRCMAHWCSMFECVCGVASAAVTLGCVQSSPSHDLASCASNYPLGRHRHAIITYEQSKSVVQLVTAAAMVTSTDIITSSRGIGIVRAWKLELFPAELCNRKNQNLKWRLRIYHRRPGVVCGDWVWGGL